LKVLVGDRFVTCLSAYVPQMDKVQRRKTVSGIRCSVWQEAYQHTRVYRCWSRPEWSLWYQCRWVQWSSWWIILWREKCWWWATTGVLWCNGIDCGKRVSRGRSIN